MKKFVEYCDVNNDKSLSVQELMGCLGVTKEEGKAETKKRHSKNLFSLSFPLNSSKLMKPDIYMCQSYAKYTCLQLMQLLLRADGKKFASGSLCSNRIKNFPLILTIKSIMVGNLRRYDINHQKASLVLL